MCRQIYNPFNRMIDFLMISTVLRPCKFTILSIIELGVYKSFKVLRPCKFTILSIDDRRTTIDRTVLRPCKFTILSILKTLVKDILHSLCFSTL